MTKTYCITIRTILIIVLVCNCFSCSVNNEPDQDAIFEFVNSYLTQRYNDITAENVQERYDITKKYYSNSLINENQAWGINEKQREESLSYFQQTGYTTKLESIGVTYESGTYIVKAAVVYFTNDHLYDYVTNYIFNMSFIEDSKQGYLIDTIECVSNETLQITDGIIHVSDGVAHVADHHGECDHEH